MGDNSQILKLMRIMNSTPKYWILSPNTVMVGSHNGGRPFLSPEKVFKDKIVLTIPEDNPYIFCKWMIKKCYDGYYRWEYIGICDNNLDFSDIDLDKEYNDQYDTTIEKMKSDLYKFYNNQQDSNYDWMRHSNTAGLNNGSDAGHFQLDSKQAEINNRIFNNASTENIGHDKEDIEDILTESTASDVKSSSISENLKYMKIKQDKYGSNSMTQNITITGGNNTVIGITMNQTGEDDCEQTQTVIIKNSKSEKKKEKKESVFGVLHHALINLAKIVELSTQYLLEYVRNIFFG